MTWGQVALAYVNDSGLGRSGNVNASGSGHLECQQLGVRLLWKCQ